MMKNAVLTALIALQTVTVSGSAPLAFDRPNSSDSGWQLPFAQPHRLVRQYLQPTSDYSAGHRGVDFAAQPGDLVMAPADGTVSFANFLVNRPVIAIKHGSGLVTELEPACADVEVGDAVMRGQRIGKACNGGSDYANHCANEFCLHFSLRLNGKYLSPLALIGGLNPSRLLPYARG
jgi:murein DD-endopeptidase MepM/ murein hydrolase activator NlpD